MSGKRQIAIANNVLRLASEILGINENVTIDSGIFKHMYEGEFDEERDIIVIVPGEDGIDMDDISIAFSIMYEQFEEIEGYGRSYFLDDIIENGDYSYKLVWGS